MYLISSLMFGVSASLDALLVGISLGLRGVQIRLRENLLISLITLSGTCLSVSLGQQITPLLPSPLGGCAGSLILMLLGIYYIIKWILDLLRGPQESDLASSGKPAGKLSLPQLLALSLTLSVNNIGIGLSASMAGLPLLPASISTFSCSLLFLFSGNRLGKSRLLRLAGDMADPLSGALLIALGMVQLFL